MEPQEQNIVSDGITLAQQSLALRDSITEYAGRWNNNSFSTTITDADLAAIPDFQHLDETKLAALVTALNTITTALGDNSSGQAVNLIKALP